MTDRPRLLDLFCGAGGAGEGYRRAGFDVVGVDLIDHGYPVGDFIKADALRVLRGLEGIDLADFDAVHASPPCQAYSDLRTLSSNQHPDLVGPVRDLLRRWGGAWVIENVEGAPMVEPLTLCGSEFGLGAHCADGKWRQLRRHRLFESSVWLMGAGGCMHRGQPVGVYGTGGGGPMTRGYKGDLRESREAIGAPWMSRAAVSLSIPPAFTEHIGAQLIDHLREQAAA